MTTEDTMDGRLRIDRRTALKLAALTGAGGYFAAGTAGAAESGGIDRVMPARTPPWEATTGGGPRWAEDRWFVELPSAPAIRGGSARDHGADRARFEREARREGIDYGTVGDFQTLWNGLVLEVDRPGAAAVRGLDAVSSVSPVAIVEQPEPLRTGVEPNLDFALELTGADIAHDLGLTGDGIDIAIVDSGVDYNHLDLGGDGDPNVVYTATDAEERALTDEDGNPHPRISHGWDYVGPSFVPGVEPDPNPDPMDPMGHGTMVAGIAGADAANPDGGVTGVAPEITFGAYKIFDQAGISTADHIVAAMEDAYADGMDVINLSLGAWAWGQAYPTTAATNALVEDGIVVVAAAGNAGLLGMWSLNAPANAHDGIAAASAENTHFSASYFDVPALDTRVPFEPLFGAQAPPTAGESEPLSWIGRACAPDDVFDEEEEDELLDDPDGKIALIRRGDCFFSTKYDRAVEAGAEGVIIFNNEPGLFLGSVEGAEHEGAVWGVSIGQDDGETLVKALEDDETITFEYTAKEMIVETPGGGLVSMFSSYGQDVELGAAPSLTAPGGLITSTMPIELGEYGTQSGTSLSAPHIAGAVALLQAEEPDLDPLTIRDRLQNTSDPLPWSLSPRPGIPRPLLPTRCGHAPDRPGHRGRTADVTRTDRRGRSDGWRGQP